METDDGWRRSILSWKDRFVRPHTPTYPPPIGTLRLAQAPTTHAADAARDPGDTGTTVWDGALVLAAALAAHPAATVAGRRVVELGSGVGLVGVVAAKAGATATVLTDLPSVLPLLRRNVAANAPYGRGGDGACSGGKDDGGDVVGGKGLLRAGCSNDDKDDGSGSGGGRGSGGDGRRGGGTSPPHRSSSTPTVTVAECKWGDAADVAAVVAALGGPPDMVLASDVVYADAAVAPLVATLSALLPAGSSGTALWAQEAHRPEPIAAFEAALAEGGWELSDVDPGLLDPAVMSDAIRVVRIRRAQGEGGEEGGRGGGGGVTVGGRDNTREEVLVRRRKRRRKGSCRPGLGRGTPA
ncbi:hypothetical protein MMPV_005480 [Pyropia vietnamensis]